MLEFWTWLTTMASIEKTMYHSHPRAKLHSQHEGDFLVSHTRKASTKFNTCLIFDRNI